MTLEEVALDAVAEDGRLVARTSARQVAERLGVDPGTAAGALRVLRDRGLLISNASTGRRAVSACRSTCSARSAGLTVIPPCAALPQMATPPMVNRRSGRYRGAGAELGGAMCGSTRHGRTARGRTHTDGRPSAASSAVPGAGGVRVREGVVVSALGVASPEGWPMPGRKLCRVEPEGPWWASVSGLGSRHSYRFSRKPRSVSGGRYRCWAAGVGATRARAFSLRVRSAWM